MSNIKFAAIMPHPPILVPAVGGKRLKEVDQTRKALEKLAKQLKNLEEEIDTIVVITPHGAVSAAAVPVYASHVYEGSFFQFGVSKPVFSFKGDAELARLIVKEAEQKKVPASLVTETLLDHGVLVPLSYPCDRGVKKPILPIAIAFMPLSRLYDFGKVLLGAIEKRGRNIAIIASADMSHRLTPSAPSGYSPRGREFDDKLVALVRSHDVEGILNFDPELAQEAGQDALWSIAVLLGALEGLNFSPEVLSYEGPFGVGYMVVEYKMTNDKCQMSN